MESKKHNALHTTGPYYDSFDDLIQQLLGQLQYCYDIRYGAGQFKKFLDQFYEDRENFDMTTASIVDDFSKESEDNDKLETIKKRLIASTKISLFFCCDAMEYYRDGETSAVLYHVAEASKWLGITQGIFQSLEAFSEELHLLAKAGAKKRAEKYQPLRNFVLDEVSKKNYKSKRHAALSLKNEVLKLAETLGIGLSEPQAEKTISGWLTGITFASKKDSSPANIRATS